MINENVLKKLDFDEKVEICAINNESLYITRKKPKVAKKYMR